MMLLLLLYHGFDYFCKEDKIYCRYAISLCVAWTLANASTNMPSISFRLS